MVSKGDIRYTIFERRNELTDENPRFRVLTQRQKQVLQLLIRTDERGALVYTDRDIGEEIGFQYSAVWYHARNGLRFLDEGVLYDSIGHRVSVYSPMYMLWNHKDRIIDLLNSHPDLLSDKEHTLILMYCHGEQGLPISISHFARKNGVSFSVEHRKFKRAWNKVKPFIEHGSTDEQIP